MNEEKSSLKILSPEIEVGKYKVKPWSFEQFLSILPSLIQIGAILKEKGIKLEDVEALKNDGVKLGEIILCINPFIPMIIAKTLRIEIEQVNEMDFDEASSIALVILIQNAEKLKNFSGLGKSALSSLIG